MNGRRTFPLLTLLLTILLFTTVRAQETPVTFPYERFDTDGVPSMRHRERREALMAAHSDRCIILLLSADVRNRQNDVDYEYRQNSSFLYLTGGTEPSCAIILVPGGASVDGSVRDEVFFVRPRDTRRESWTGVSMGMGEAKELLGVRHAVEYSRLGDLLDSLLSGRDTLYIASGLPTPSLSSPLLTTRLSTEQAIKDRLHASHPDLYVRTTMSDLAAMREVKDEHEIRLLQKAINISIEGHLATIRAAVPGIKEYQLEAVMEHGFRYNGAEDVGYPSIVGSGYNACILHYQSNRRTTRLGELVLADCGAEYHGYTADITRTFPVNGTYSPEQRMIYDIVLEAQDSGIARCRAGNAFRSPHKAAMEVVQRRLLERGIIKEPKEAERYFMHGTSHYLGLDVHDAGTGGPLKPRVVLTVEPGIYIPKGSPCDPRWWEIGVRIE
ncbi:MAG: aminopeptidase P family protein, partial [Candidatus Kapaibacterium sp.]